MIAKGALFQLAKLLEGLPVLGCLAGTPAARAGVCYGDVLISVNGQRTRTFVDYIEAKARRTDGMEIVVFRSGAEQVVRFDYDTQRKDTDVPTLLAELITMRVNSGFPDGPADPDPV